MRLLLAVLVGALALSALFGASTTATAGGRSCPDAAGNGGYAYAGYQATQKGHGVRATISATRAPQVAAGHVAGWVGLGGPGQGPNGEDMWIQVGLASMSGMGTFLYAEVTRPGRDPSFLLLDESVAVGESHRLAVLEASNRPGSWQVWVDGRPVTKPVHLPRSSGRWAPIATSESWNGGQAACNGFAFRFEQVSVSHARGGTWRAFVPGHRFLDRGHQLRPLTSATKTNAASRSLSSGSPLPYAFVASSG